MSADSPTLPGLVPLQQVPGFDSRLIDELKPYWITSAEEFATLRQVANSVHGDGLRALSATLRLSAEKQHELLQACLAKSTRALSYTVFGELDVGAGLDIDDDFAPPPPIPHFAAYTYPAEGMLLPHAHLGPAKQQGSRNTCVAFTMVAMYRIITQSSEDLSEQFLYWACKQRDTRASPPGMPPPLLKDGRGTLPQFAVQALIEDGVCLEAEWPYKYVKLEEDVDNGRPSEAVRQLARKRRITSGGPLAGNATHSAAICQALSEGLPVLLGVWTYPFWYAGGQSRKAGRVRARLDGEAKRNGHAICAVGYKQDPAAPGGGYIIFRNSYGTDFGEENPDGSGYGHIPYAVVDKDNMFAWVIDPPASTTEAGLGEMGAGAAGTGLIAQARDALTRARAEIDRLESLLGRLEQGER